MTERCCLSKSQMPQPIVTMAKQHIGVTYRRVPSVVLATVAFLLPKCPLCIAAWAAGLGIGTVWQQRLMLPFSPLLRSLLTALLLIPLSIQFAIAARVLWWRMRRRGASSNPTFPPILRVFRNEVSSCRRKGLCQTNQ